MSDDGEYLLESDESDHFSEIEDDDLFIVMNRKNFCNDDSFAIQYSSLTTDDVRSKMDGEVSNVGSIVGADLALVALLVFRWNRDKLLDLYTESPESTLNTIGEPADSTTSIEVCDKTAGQSGPPKKRIKRDNSANNIPYVCDICCDESIYVPSDPVMKCKHQFCVDCWNTFLTTTIMKEGQCLILCMAGGCNAPIKGDFIKRTVQPEIYERWEALVMQSYVTSSTQLRFCPSPSCQSIVECMSARSDFDMTAPNVVCSDGHTFCFGCGMLHGHVPIICKLASCWRDGEDFGSAQWIKANTRQCPKCKNNIEKAGGCNRMLCKHCQFQFCWVCLKDWSVHGYNKTVCNSYVEPGKTAAMNKAQVDLERWTFYYNRFSNHEISAQLDEELVMKAEEKMSEMQHVSGSWIESQFMRQAVDELTKCRRTLKWTYAMAHYLAAGNAKQIFEDIQADLEKAVEELSQLIDSPVEEATYKDLRKKMIDKTAYVSTRHEVVRHDVAKKLTEGLWEWTIPLY